MFVFVIMQEEHVYNHNLIYSITEIIPYREITSTKTYSTALVNLQSATILHTLASALEEANLKGGVVHKIADINIYLFFFFSCELLLLE